MKPHEPECVSLGAWSLCVCQEVKMAYQRGYTAGYNAHATSAQEWRDTHGAYTQHGAGENP